MASDDSSSERSLSASPSPNSRRRFPSLAFADAISIPFKSPLSQPSTTSISPDFSLSPITPPSSFSSPAFASCAYPDWPQRDILSPNASPYCGSTANSYISDDDLLDLAELELAAATRVAVVAVLAGGDEEGPADAEEEEEELAVEEEEGRGGNEPDC
ncbi:MAG: hypothetical protein ASARMPRED_003112 [Alectoria sarmentosa]|nr:MAG: hypothetical protein ASARMPRED_003112 [Alectoria sarmentosa]